MIYFLEGDQLEEQQKDMRKGVDFRPCLAILNKDEIKEESEYLQLPAYFLTELFAGQSCKFESHEGFDYISLCIPEWSDLPHSSYRTAVYYRSNLLVLACENERGRQLFTQLLRSLSKKGMRSLSLEHILYEFFARLTEEDSGRMEEIEKEIFSMEESLIMEADSNYIQKIIDLRRRLLVLKRYYEQLLDIAEALEENENELLSGSIVRLFRMLTNRTDRLMDGVLNLRDYVSQVREAYQAQVDIKQNEIMKLFTVITSIFLPLTLIAGWYGMNLKMPEFQWVYSYPVVILVSIAVAVASCLYFKKNKWF